MSRTLKSDVLRAFVLALLTVVVYETLIVVVSSLREGGTLETFSVPLLMIGWAIAGSVLTVVYRFRSDNWRTAFLKVRDYFLALPIAGVLVYLASFLF